MLHRHFICSFGLALCASLSHAGGHTGPGEAHPRPDWQFSIGAGAIHSPEYLGAEDNETRAIPNLAVKYKDVFEFNGIRGLSYKVYGTEMFELKIGAGFDFGRDEDDADLLEGLGDVDSAVEPRIGIKLKQKGFEATLDFSSDLGGDGHDGSKIELGLGMTRPLNRQWILKPGISATYANDNFMQSYFGISADQETSSTAGLTEYSAEAGIYEIAARLNVIYLINPHWNVFGFIKHASLQNDAEDSPTTLDDQQTSAGLILSYTF